MSLRYKLLSAVSAIAMMSGVSAVQAAELLTSEQLDTVTSGAEVAAVIARGEVASAIAIHCNPCTIGGNPPIVAGPSSVIVLGTAAD